MRKYGFNEAKLVLFHRDGGNFTAKFSGIRNKLITNIGWAFIRLGFKIMYKNMEIEYDQPLDKV